MIPDPRNAAVTSVTVNFSEDVTGVDDADFGFGATTSLSILFKEKYWVHLSPELSILRTKSEVTSSNKMSFANASLMLGLYLTKKIQFNAGMKYSYLIKRISKFDGQSADFTFFRNHRSFLYPTVNVAYDLPKDWVVYFKFDYFLQDLFNSGALDQRGNIVGPVQVFPYSFGLGFNYRLKLSSK